MKNSIIIAILALLGFKSIGVCAELPIAPSNPTYNSTENIPRVASEPRPEQTNTRFDDCTRVYDITVENLFFLTLAAINANNYRIDEIQSRTGYISFEANKKMFLASITIVNNESAMIKITPMDNSYSFHPFIIEKVFAYLEANSQ